MQVLSYLMAAMASVFVGGWPVAILVFLAGVYLGFDTDYMPAVLFCVLFGALVKASRFGGKDGKEDD